MLIIHANILSMDQNDQPDGYIRIDNGKIAEIGAMQTLKNFENAIDAKGMLTLPGFIDAHTHIGMWEDGMGVEGDDGNEDTDPSTPQLRAIDAINPMEKSFSEALIAGITTVVTGPGSANPISGQLLAMKTSGIRIDDMVIKEPLAMKFALGENPKNTYHEKSQTPVTRMATASIIREQLQKAKRYLQEVEKAKAEEEIDLPEYDMKCESLIPLLQRKIQAHFHAHRADDIFTAIRIAKEFQLDYVLIHATEGHKIAKYLQEEQAKVICGPIIATRTKPELASFTTENVAILVQHGIQAAIATDHPEVPIDCLAMSCQLSMRDGLNYMDALKAITITPAKICKIDDRVGSISVGKDADLLFFEEDPLLTNAKPKMVFVNGERVI